MRRGTWAGVVAVAVAAANAALFVACVGDDPESTPTTTTDAGGDGGGTNGGDDANASETSTTDAAQSSDAGADSACANKYATADFCDDFDNGGYLPGWVKQENAPGVTLSVVSAPAFSPPFSLSAFTTATVPDGGFANTGLAKTTSTAGATEFKLEAQVRQLSASSPSNPNSSPQAMSLAIGPTASLLFQIRPSSSVAVCTAPGKVLGGFGPSGEIPFAYDAWHHVTLKAVVAGGGSVINLSCDVDGVTKSDTASTTVVDATAAASIGLYAPEGQGAIRYFFDDVVFDVK